MKIITREDLQKMLECQHWATVNRWLSRGDKVAVYENQNMGSGEEGHLKFLSFGSEKAQVQGEPPERMPDIGAFNWAYYLLGIYSGDLLPTPPAVITYRGNVVNTKNKVIITVDLPLPHGKPLEDLVAEKLKVKGITIKRGWKLLYWIIRDSSIPSPEQGMPYTRNLT